MKFDERNKKKIPPFFISMATAAKFVLPIPIFLAYLVPLEVDVTGNITAKHFLHLGYHGNGCHFEFFQPPKAATHYNEYSYEV
jgi:hypothetical protein